MIRTDIIQPAFVLLQRQAEAFPDKIAFEDAVGAITYGELARTTGNVAGRLAEHGVQAGDSVALYLPNSTAWAEACFAILRVGGVVVPIAYDSTAKEAQYRLEDADCRIVITMAGRQSIVAEAAGAARTCILADDAGPQGYPALRAAGAPSPLDPDDIDCASFIVYTSGTTGQPKGVRLSLRSMLWVTASCWMPIAEMGPDDVVLSPLPLFHSYALNLSVLSIVATGASEYIIDRFSPDRVLALMAERRFTIFPGVPTMFHYLMEAAKGARPKLNDLRLCISAGAIMPATLNTDFEDAFGVLLLDAYGITETATIVTMNWASGGRVPGSCGVPLLGLATRIVNPVTDQDMAVGEEGELIVRGPNLMLGYHNKPEETAKALKDGWYRTGDLAKADPNGFLTITGRLKELIIRGGQNIAPAEVEEVASAHPDVLDCAVVGQPHEHLGEVPVIYVVPRAEDAFAVEALLAFCRERLSAYKIPVAVHVVKSIPRTGSGKIMRFKLGAE